MTAGATVTWLTHQAEQAPEEALVSCESVFARYAGSGVREAPFVAVVSLATEIRLQLEAKDTEAAIETAIETADRLARYLGALPASDLDPQITAMIKCATRLLASRVSSSAERFYSARASKPSRLRSGATRLAQDIDVCPELSLDSLQRWPLRFRSRRSAVALTRIG